MNLDEPQTTFTPPADRRPRIPEPPPVRLVAVDDVHLIASAGLEPQLDRFYVGLLGFRRNAGPDFPAYQSENFRLLFDVLEPPIQHRDLRPLGIEVPSLAAVEHGLIDAEHEYTRQRGLLPGQESLLLLDPAGNWVEIAEWREVQ